MGIVLILGTSDGVLVGVGSEDMIDEPRHVSSIVIQI